MGRAFGKESLRAFGLVGGSTEMTEACGLALKSGFEGQVDALVHRAQGLGDGERRVGGDLESQRFGPLHQLAGGNHFIHEADAERFLCVNDRAGEEKLERGSAAHQTSQPLCTAVAADDTEFYFRLAKPRIVGSDTQGAGHGQLAPAAKGESPDAGNHGLAQGFNFAKDALAPQCECPALFGAKRSEFADVGSGGKGTVPRAGEQKNANIGIGGKFVQHRFQFGQGRGVESIQDFGPVDGDDGQGRAFFEADVRGVHANRRLAEWDRFLPFVSDLAGVVTAGSTGRPGTTLEKALGHAPVSKSRVFQSPGVYKIQRTNPGPLVSSLGNSMKRSKSREDSHSRAWKTVPRWAIVVFLLAVFCIFASFGFVFDGMDMARQSALSLALSSVIIALFSVGYAVSGITLRQRFWIPGVPLFILQNVCMALLYNWLPKAPALTHLDSTQLNSFHNRLVFDGLAVVISVVLGYTGLVVVSIAESRRRLRVELDKAALDTELAAAREIQRLMVPEMLPPTPGYAIESIYHPAAQVGGDFFQVIPLDGGQTLVVVGDVSGKGLSAAMIVSMLIGMLHTISRISQDPAQILAELNSRLFERKQGGFVTCLAVRLDPSGRVVLANAGHLPPWLNGAEVAFAGSLPLSLLASAAPEQVALEMQPGDRLTLITDGVVEARDTQGALFGFDRTQALMRQETSPLALAEAAIQYGQDDDLTVISILRTA